MNKLFTTLMLTTTFCWSAEPSPPSEKRYEGTESAHVSVVDEQEDRQKLDELIEKFLMEENESSEAKSLLEEIGGMVVEGNKLRSIFSDEDAQKIIESPSFNLTSTFYKDSNSRENNLLSLSINSDRLSILRMLLSKDGVNIQETFSKDFVISYFWPVLEDTDTFKIFCAIRDLVMLSTEKKAQDSDSKAEEESDSGENKDEEVKQFFLNIIHNKTDKVEEVLRDTSYGAIVESSLNNWNAMDWALALDRQDIVEKLQKKGVKSTQPFYFLLPELKAVFEKDSTEQLEKIFDISDAFYGNLPKPFYARKGTLLHYAVKKRAENVLRYLLGMEQIEKKRVDGKGATPFCFAIQEFEGQEEQKQILNVLLERREYDVNEQWVSEKKTTLNYVVEEKSEENGALVLLEFLIERGADIWENTASGKNLWDEAFEARKPKVLEFLLRKMMAKLSEDREQIRAHLQAIFEVAIGFQSSDEREITKFKECFKVVLRCAKDHLKDLQFWDGVYPITAAQHAVFKSNLPVFEVMLEENQGLINERDRELKLNAADVAFYLSLGAQKNSQYLMLKGLSTKWDDFENWLDQRLPGTKVTPLELAVLSQKKHIIELLMTKSTSKNIENAIKLADSVMFFEEKKLLERAQGGSEETAEEKHEEYVDKKIRELRDSIDRNKEWILFESIKKVIEGVLLDTDPKKDEGARLKDFLDRLLREDYGCSDKVMRQNIFKAAINIYPKQEEKENYQQNFKLLLDYAKKKEMIKDLAFADRCYTLAQYIVSRYNLTAFKVILEHEPSLIKSTDKQRGFNAADIIIFLSLNERMYKSVFHTYVEMLKLIANEWDGFNDWVANEYPNVNEMNPLELIIISTAGQLEHIAEKITNVSFIEKAIQFKKQTLFERGLDKLELIKKDLISKDGNDQQEDGEVKTEE